jgi:hypothetical protein
VLSPDLEVRLFEIIIIITITIIKLKESRNRPSVAQSIPGGLDSQIP